MPSEASNKTLRLIAIMLGWGLVIIGILILAYVGFIFAVVYSSPQLHSNETASDYLGIAGRIIGYYALPLITGIVILVLARRIGRPKA